ncbi:hypothetical protein AURDEDRAFT_176740 [Auricularia subglabra TFB-10046 SS5]|uniref:Uncharacterized protein n=1 Tax=Auricularia subglabra (strain TFB-10046 / SS5) TaxID=717982 RepID=J0CUZ6_AURST|nr:hypothetical protein AURDEDRAFT_176740 [Auricularia subglabra TFB-10046 SS5]
MALCGANPEAIVGLHLNTERPPYSPDKEATAPASRRRRRRSTKDIKTHFPENAEVLVYVEAARLFEKRE